MGTEVNSVNRSADSALSLRAADSAMSLKAAGSTVPLRAGDSALFLWLEDSALPQRAAATHLYSFSITYGGNFCRKILHFLKVWK